MRKYFLAFLIGVLSLWQPVFAEGDLEVISLKHRTVEEVIPSLRPLLEPDGVLTGMQGQLILRASPANRAQIKQALEALDTPLRQLRITVRQSMEVQQDQREAELYGKANAGNVRVLVPPTRSSGARVEVDTGNARIGGRFEDRDMNRFSRVSQEIRVLDGGQAFIRAGTSLPMTQREVIWGQYGQTVRESTVYRDVDSGFYVRPQVVGQRVTLEINPVQQSISTTSPHAVVGQQMFTTVSGQVGEWIALGGADQTDSERNRALLGSRNVNQRKANQVWLKVEIVD